MVKFLATTTDYSDLQQQLCTWTTTTNYQQLQLTLLQTKVTVCPRKYKKHGINPVLDLRCIWHFITFAENLGNSLEAKLVQVNVQKHPAINIFPCMLYIQLVFCRPQNYICQFFFWLHLKSFYVASSDFCAIVLNSRFKFLVKVAKWISSCTRKDLYQTSLSSSRIIFRNFLNFWSPYSKPD